MRKETPASDMARRRLPGGCSIILPAALALALFIAFAGLGITGHDPRLLRYQYETVDAAHVTRAHLDHNGMMAPLDRTVTDTRAAQALYDMAFALPVYHPPVMHCPLGPAVVYHLAFSRQGAAVLTDDLSLDGFISVSLGGVDTRLCDERFLALLARTLGMSVEAITQPLVYAPNPPIPPITLTVERIGETSTTQVAPFSKTITDANVAFMLDNALARYSTYGGSSAPPPASACPPNDGVLYRLTFYQAGVRFAVKDIEATGCQLIFTHDGFPPEHVSDLAFWRLLAQALDVPLASLGVGPTMA